MPLDAGVPQSRPSRNDTTARTTTSRSAPVQVPPTRVLASASMRFDKMLQRAKEIPFAKQPVVERSTGAIVGYSGVGWFDFEGEQRLELGYRLVPRTRGMGYATEASLAVLSMAARTFRGELLTIIHPANVASTNVAEKLGFTFWKQAAVDGHLRKISRRPVPAPHLELSARPSRHP